MASKKHGVESGCRKNKRSESRGKSGASQFFLTRRKSYPYRRRCIRARKRAAQRSKHIHQISSPGTPREHAGCATTAGGDLPFLNEECDLPVPEINLEEYLTAMGPPKS